MNMTEVSGTLLHSGYQYDDGLMLDLYGCIEEDGHSVESIAVAGTKTEIGQLFRARQLEHMGYWLDLKDGNAPQKIYAERHQHYSRIGYGQESTRGQ